MCTVSGDFSMPSAFWDSQVKAKKRHECCECGSTIEPGETYRLVRGIWENEFCTYKQCELCSERMYEENSRLQYDEAIPFTCLWEIIGLD